jgi:tetratricopeptide (TPR) repeat protein
VRGTHFFSAVILAALLASVTIAQETPAGSQQRAARVLSAAEIEQAIAELGHDEYPVREAASKRLWEAGLVAEPALRKALARPDAEIRQRAKVILDKFDLGLTPDMPKEFELLLSNFRNGPFPEKQQILAGLINEKKVKLALQLGRSEKNEAQRIALLANVSRLAQRFVPELLLEGNLDDAELILESVDPAADSSIERLTVVLLLSGRLPDRLKATEEKVAGSKNVEQIKRLIYFRRASGDLAGAVQLARQAGLLNYQREILVEQGDWAGAAAVQEAIYKDQRMPADARAYLAALYHFAGNHEQRENHLAQLRTNAVEQVSTYWDAAEAHLVCEQPEEAIKLLSESIPGGASYFHYLRMNYAESQRLGNITKETKFDKAWYDSLVDGGRVATQMRLSRDHFARDLARQLHLLGERERAREIMAVLRAEADNDRGGRLWQTVLSGEAALGDRQQVLLGLKRAAGRPGISTSQLFAALYPRDVVLADTLYNKLGTEDENKRQETLTLIERLFGPAGYTEEQRKSLIEQVAKEIEPWLASSDYRLQLRGGDLFLRLEDRDRARTWFERAAESSTDANLRLGDLAREKQDWDEAVRRYRKAIDIVPALPIAHFLLGQALIAANAEEEGKQELQRASWIALAPVTRLTFARQLNDLGYSAAAAEQAQLVMKTSNPLMQNPTVAAGHLRGNIVRDQLPLEAAQVWQRWELSMLSGVNNYQLYEHYLVDPEVIHRRRAQALLAAGKMDEAIAEFRQVLVMLPGNARAIEEFVPQLEKAGRGETAAALFDEVASRYEGVIRDYPATSHHRRELALMCARCQRRLDDALRLAQEAVQREETTAVNHDALAEVHAARGEHQAAVQAGERALERERNNPDLRRRLARWRGLAQGRP